MKCDCEQLDNPIRFYLNEAEYVCEFDDIHSIK